MKRTYVGRTGFIVTFPYSIGFRHSLRKPIEKVAPNQIRNQGNRRKEKSFSQKVNFSHSLFHRQLPEEGEEDKIATKVKALVMESHP